MLATLFNIFASAIILSGKALGGGPSVLCAGIVIFGRGILWGNMMIADTIVVLRYVFTCHFGNILACNDDLLYNFLAVVIGTLPLYFSLLHWFASDVKYYPPYYTCTAEYPYVNCKFANSMK